MTRLFPLPVWTGIFAVTAVLLIVVPVLHLAVPESSPLTRITQLAVCLSRTDRLPVGWRGGGAAGESTLMLLTLIVLTF